MRSLILVSLSSVLVAACSGGELIDLGGDAGQSPARTVGSSGGEISPSSGGGISSGVGTSDSGTTSDAADGGSFTGPTWGLSRSALVSTLTCPSFDASAPSLDANGGFYSIPLPGTGSPASPSDGWIVFVSDSNRDGSCINAIHPDGSGLVGLVCGDPSISDPAISPDGTTIAFTAAVGDGTSQVILQAGSLKTLTAMSGGADQPTFSPDGKSIAFHSVGSIYVMHSDGTDVRPLIVSDGQREFEHPTFTPDGSALLVDGLNEIDAFDLSGGHSHYVVANGTISASYPVISRDGLDVAFVDGTCSPYGMPPDRIGVVPLGGYVADACTACLGSGYNLGQLSHPSWGPGTLITYSHLSSGGLKRIVVADTANLGAEPIEIVQDMGNQQDPVWAPSTFDPTRF